MPSPVDNTMNKGNKVTFYSSDDFQSFLSAILLIQLGLLFMMFIMLYPSVKSLFKEDAYLITHLIAKSLCI